MNTLGIVLVSLALIAFLPVLTLLGLLLAPVLAPLVPAFGPWLVASFVGRRTASDRSPVASRAPAHVIVHGFQPATV